MFAQVPFWRTVPKCIRYSEIWRHRTISDDVGFNKLYENNKPNAYIAMVPGSIIKSTKISQACLYLNTFNKKKKIQIRKKIPLE